MHSSRIYLGKSARAQMMEKFKVSPSNVSYALNFRYNSILMRQLRVYAVNWMRACPVIDDSMLL